MLFGGLEQKLAQLTAAAEAAMQANGANAEQQQAKEQEQKDRNEKAEIAEDELKVALRQQIGSRSCRRRSSGRQGYYHNWRRWSISVRFSRTDRSARQIMEEIAGVNESGSGEITVSGHTDDVPLIFGSQFRDNWDLPQPRVLQALFKR